MGKIIDMQNNQNEVSFNYVKKKNPKLDTKGIKNFYNKLRLAYKPGIETEYSLTRGQKNFARTVRGTTLGIMILASSIGISSIVYNHIDRENSKNEATYQNDYIFLDRETVFTEAKEALANIVLPNDSSSSNIPGQVSFPTRDNGQNINSVEVSELVLQKYYPRYKYIIDSKTNKDNSETFNRFADKLIEIARNSNPNQEDLRELKELTEEILELNLKLDGKNIVDQNEKDLDFER